jgi:molybdopterin-guanine dinucleotide biosynthesis protein
MFITSSTFFVSVLGIAGTKESGKTTVMKQMRLLYGAGYAER